ncbi:MAG: hypothetical protein HRU70_12435 [Phycisphaeraceae bacterium]|nr:MAG: hypothetical protein HRU70_12435 [Phycisphaeraceae bacterium]
MERLRAMADAEVGGVAVGAVGEAPEGLDVPTLAIIPPDQRRGDGSIDAAGALERVRGAVPASLSALTRFPEVSGASKAEALSRFARGRQLMAEGKPAEALVEFEASAKADPVSVEPWERIAEAQSLLGRRAASSSALVQAVRRGFREPRGLIALGREAARSLRHDESAWLLATGREGLSGEDDAVLRALAEADLAEEFERRGWYAAALELWTLAASAEPGGDRPHAGVAGPERAELVRRRGEFWQRVGDLAFRLERLDEARAAYARGAGEASLDPGAVVARRVVLAARAGRPAEAALVLLEKIAASKGRVEDRELALLRSLSSDATRAGVISDALGEIARGPGVTGSVAGRLTRARAAVLRPDDGRAVLADYLASTPGDSDAAWDLAASFADGDLAARDRALAAVVAKNPKASSAAADALLADGRGVIAASERLMNASGEAERLLGARLTAALGKPTVALRVLDAGPWRGECVPAARDAEAEIAAACGAYERAWRVAQGLAGDQSASGRASLASALAGVQRFGEALAALDPEARWDALAFDERVLAASVALRAGEGARAEAMLRRLTAEDPSDERAFEVLIRLYASSGPGGAPDESLLGVVRALREGVSSSRVLRFIAASELAQRGQWTQAEDGFLSLAEENPRSPGLIERLVTVWMRQGGPALSRGGAWLSARLAASPENPDFLAGMARIRAASGDHAGALAMLDAYTAKAPIPALRRLRESITADPGGDEAGAARLRLERLESGPRTIEETFSLADLLLTGDRASEGPRVVREGLPEFVPLTDEQQTALVLLAVQAVQRDTALAGRGPAVSPGYLALVDERVTSPRVEVPTALREGMVVALAQADPADPDAVAAAVRSMIGTLREPELNAVSRVATRLLNGERPAAAVTFAEGLVKAGWTSERAEVLARVIAWAGGADDARRLMPLLLSGDGGVALLERLMQSMDPIPPAGQREPEIAYQLASLAAVRERREAADGLYRLALDYNPAHTMTCNDFGYHLLTDGGKPEEGARLIETAYARDSSNPHILDSIGWVRYLQGRLHDTVDEAGRVVSEGAVSLLIRARLADGDDDNTEMMDHLGDAHWAVGKREEALDFWGRASRLADGFLAELRAQGASDQSRQVKFFQGIRRASQEKLKAVKEGRDPPIASMIMVGSRPVGGGGDGGGGGGGE